MTPVLLWLTLTCADTSSVPWGCSEVEGFLDGDVSLVAVASSCVQVRHAAGLRLGRGKAIEPRKLRSVDFGFYFVAFFSH